MRRCSCLYTALSLVALALPIALQAQKFQEPTKEELQMTADPKDPAAPAVFLYREEKTDNSSHYYSLYARVKIFKEEGKKWATVEVHYDPVYNAPPIVEARIIHSDGSIVPLSIKEADLAIKPYKDNLKTAAFTLPNVEVGSILEYRWTVRVTEANLPFTISDSDSSLYSSRLAKHIPTWEVQQDIPVRKARYYFAPFSLHEAGASFGNITEYAGFIDGERATNLLFTERLPAGAHVARSPKGDYFLELKEIPALPVEPYALPDESRAYRVVFYFTRYAFPNDYWESEIKRWTKHLDHFAEPAPAILDAALQITAGASTPEAKARKLYDAVQALENTDFLPPAEQARQPNPNLDSNQAKGLAALPEKVGDVLQIRFAPEGKQPREEKGPKQAKGVWDGKSGSGRDLAGLYLALARAAGLDANGMMVADRSQHLFDPNYLALRQLDALLVVLNIDGKEIYLDPGDKFCPFGQLDWRHAVSGGILQNAKSASMSPANQVTDAVTSRVADLTVDEKGAVQGTLKIAMSGPEALRWRQLNLTAGSAELRSQFAASLHALLPAGITAELGAFQGVDAAAGGIAVTAKLSGQLGSLSDGRLRLPGFFFSAASHDLNATAEKRSDGVDIHFAGQVIDDAVYHLPAGYTVESAPQPAQIPWAHRAALAVKTVSAPGSIDIKRIYARVFVLLDPKEYPAMQEFDQKVAANDQQQIVLAPAK